MDSNAVKLAREVKAVMQEEQRNVLSTNPLTFVDIISRLDYLNATKGITRYEHETLTEFIIRWMDYELASEPRHGDPSR